MNFRYTAGGIGISLDETATLADVEDIVRGVRSCARE